MPATRRLRRIVLVQRLVAAAGVGLLLSVPAAPAYAEGTGEPFDASTCTDFQRNDPIPSWATQRLQLDRVHALATGKGVTVAIIDTGIDTHRNPALSKDGRPVTTELYNYAGSDRGRGSDGRADCAHGTRVASLIAGRAETGTGTEFVGVAPDARIIGLRALQTTSTQGQTNQPEPLEPTIRAIQRAIELRADVINISQQGSDSPEYRAAIKQAIDAGIVVVAAAGNRGGTGPLPYPAAYPGVIAVGMSDINDLPHEQSQYAQGLDITVAAPGVEVLMANPSGTNGQSWQTDTGTSFAAPMVTGTVALMLQREPDLTPADVKQRLELSSDLPPAAAPDRQLGYGVVNPYRALTDVPGRRSTATPTPLPGRAPDPTRPGATTPAGAVAVGLGVTGLAGLGLATALYAAYPSGRRRGWRHAE